MASTAEKAMLEDVDEAASNQRKFWEATIEQHYHDLVKNCLKLTGNQDTAEDIAQETIYRVLNRRTPVTVKSPLAYLCVVARNIFYDRRKKNPLHDYVSIQDEQNDSLRAQIVDNSMSEDILSRLYYEELLASLPLHTILGDFSEYKSKLLHMDAIDEMTPKEIAATLGKEVSQVRYDLQCLYVKMRYRARTILKNGKGRRNSL
ncbi:MAG TPA: RNA polymerase sigma factor [Pyrinomonadaceae bacterium]